MLLLLGDQVYADEPPEAVVEFIRGRLAWIDPDLRDDWNISYTWRQEMAGKP